MKKTKRIAVTGGIGSGKSTVINIIARFGYETIDLDEVYSELLENEEFVLGICETIGVKPLIEKGKATLDRAAVSKKVFGDKTLLKKLDSFTHERIIAAAFAKAENSGGGLVFFEVPLLFESGLEKSFDEVIVVKRALSERLKSAAKRDGVSVSDIEMRAKNQFDYDNNDLSLHIVIMNDGDVESLKEKVRKVLSELRQKE